MCNKCAKTNEVTIHCFPIEISFPAKKNKAGGLVRRIGDISGQVILDLNTVTLNTVSNYRAFCRGCGSEIDSKELFEPDETVCAFCGGAKTELCAYNELQICTECYLTHINYCSECPLRNNCTLYAKGRN